MSARYFLIGKLLISTNTIFKNNDLAYLHVQYLRKAKFLKISADINTSYSVSECRKFTYQCP